jgi:carbamoylphosphate synthase large subunit
MTNQVLVEMSLLGWKEFELEVRGTAYSGAGCWL